MPRYTSLPPNNTMGTEGKTGVRLIFCPGGPLRGDGLIGGSLRLRWVARLSAAGSSVLLKSGDQSFIRPVDSVSGQTAGPREAVPLSCDVEIGIHSPSSALFGGPRSNYRATVPDPNRSARIQSQTVGDDHLSLAVHDRIEIRAASGTSYRRLVTAVDGGIVDVETATLPPEGAPNEFLVSQTGEQDPSGWLDQWLLTEMGNPRQCFGPL